MKNDTWNLPAPPGFRGLDPTKPIRRYQRHLPHWRQEGATYFVTFRLNDAMPVAQQNLLKRIRMDWESRHLSPRTDEQWDQLARDHFRISEKCLDQGLGACWLRDDSLRKVVTDSLLHFDERRYVLGSFTIMPIHVHLIVKPIDPHVHSLEDILHSWKRYTATEINKCVNRSGALWQEESFDRIIRDEEHLYRCIQYLGMNPVKARLAVGSYTRWIRPEWERIGWGFVTHSDTREGRVGNPSYGGKGPER